MKRFFEAYGTKNINKNAPHKHATHLRIFSVAHLYPWRVAPQQSPLPFPSSAAKLFPDLYIYNLS
jgi:hypothetical protein